MEAASLPVRDDLIVGPPRVEPTPRYSTQVDGYRAVQGLLQLPSRPTAIFARNDSTAIGASQGLREAGLRTPDDISVAGFASRRGEREGAMTPCSGLDRSRPLPASAYTAGVTARQPRVDRSAFTVQALHDEPDDRRYWWSRTPAERLAAVETMRRVVYGRSAATGRLQRVLEIAQRPPR